MEYTIIILSYHMFIDKPKKSSNKVMEEYTEKNLQEEMKNFDILQ